MAGAEWDILRAWIVSGELCGAGKVTDLFAEFHGGGEKLGQQHINRTAEISQYSGRKFDGLPPSIVYATANRPDDMNIRGLHWLLRSRQCQQLRVRRWI